MLHGIGYSSLYCYYRYHFSAHYFPFSDEENVNKTNFDVKGLTVFYIFIALLMFGLLNQGHISLNTISIILAMIVMILLFKMEKN